MKPEVAVNDLAGRGLLTDGQRRVLHAHYAGELISLHYELRTLFWLGSTLLVAGIGLYITDVITPVTVIAGLSAATLACFWRAHSRKAPYARSEVASPGVVHDGVLMLGCLLFLTLQGYLDYQYALFRGSWNAWALLPTLLFAFTAYFHDHKGVLLLALTALSSWVGINVNADAAFLHDLHSVPQLIPTSIVYAVLMLGLSAVLRQARLKAHFTFVYVHFYGNMLLSAALVGYLQFDYSLLYAAILAAAAAGLSAYARIARRATVYVYAALYLYVAATVRIFDWSDAALGQSVAEFNTAYLAITASLLGAWLYRSRRVFREVSR